MTEQSESQRVFALLETLVSKIQSVEARLEQGAGVRPPKASTVSFGGSASEASTGGEETGSAEAENEFVSGEDFHFADRRRSQRFSTGSGGFMTKDTGTKIERPKFKIKQTRVIDGFKEEELHDSDILDYLDAYDHFFAMWKTIPANEGLIYSNEARVPIINIEPIYAKKICLRIKCLYDATDLTFCSLGVAQANKRSWKKMTSAELRKALGELVELETSHKGALEALQRIKFKSRFGPIDMVAFATYQHDFKKEVLRLQSGGRALDKVQLKDIIIHAYPDPSYQGELKAQFGGPGMLVGEVQDFAINDVFDDIERHIANLTREGVRAVVNKHIRAQEAQPFSPKTPGHGGAKAIEGKSVHNTELSYLFDESALQVVDTDEQDDLRDHKAVAFSSYDASAEEWQMHVNAVLANGQHCSRVGKGPDGLLLCKFLGGPKESCIFKHPDEDYKLKGKGFSTAKPFARSTNL
jgi:hypothetical protein